MEIQNKVELVSDSNWVVIVKVLENEDMSLNLLAFQAVIKQQQALIESKET
jgi:hypothetical protein